MVNNLYLWTAITTGWITILSAVIAAFIRLRRLIKTETRATREMVQAHLRKDG